MNNASCELLDMLAHWHGGDNPSTDYRLALDYFGIKPEKIYQYRRGQHMLGDERIVSICEDIWPGDDARKIYWLARVHADREQNVRIRKLWERIAQTAAAVLLVVVFSGFSGVGVEHATAAEPAIAKQTDYLLCALLLILLRLLDALRPWFAGLRFP